VVSFSSWSGGSPSLLLRWRVSFSPPSFKRRQASSGVAAGARGPERRSGCNSGQSGSGRRLGQRRARLSGGDGFERRWLGLGQRRARGKWGEEENSRPAEVLFG
jgi:hypothetical protein